MSFDAGGHYDLDAVESSVLRVGTRYTVKKMLISSSMAALPLSMNSVAGQQAWLMGWLFAAQILAVPV